MNSNQDEQHLKLLSIFHYVVGGLAGLIACIPIIHLVTGIGLLVTSLTNKSDGAPLLMIGLVFTVMGGFFVLAGWAFAILLIISGRNLNRRKKYMFCLVMAGIACIFAPFGTALGVFTIIVLIRPSVKELFEFPKTDVISPDTESESSKL